MACRLETSATKSMRLNSTHSHIIYSNLNSFQSIIRRNIQEKNKLICDGTTTTTGGPTKKVTSHISRFSTPPSFVIAKRQLFSSFWIQFSSDLGGERRRSLFQQLQWRSRILSSLLLILARSAGKLVSPRKLHLQIYRLLCSVIAASSSKV